MQANDKPIAGLSLIVPISAAPHFPQKWEESKQNHSVLHKREGSVTRLHQPLGALRLTTHRIKWQDSTANVFNHTIHQ